MKIKKIMLNIAVALLILQSPTASAKDIAKYVPLCLVGGAIISLVPIFQEKFEISQATADRKELSDDVKAGLTAKSKTALHASIGLSLAATAGFIASKGSRQLVLSKLNHINFYNRFKAILANSAALIISQTVSTILNTDDQKDQGIANTVKFAGKSCVIGASFYAHAQCTRAMLNGHF